MRIGVCTSLERLKVAPPGLDYLEAAVEDLLCPRLTEEAFAKRLAAARACAVPVEAVNLLLPGDLKTTGPRVDVTALDAYIKVIFDRAARAGVQVVVFGAGGSRRVPEGFEIRRGETQIVNHLQRWAPLAASRGMTVVLEPLNRTECNIINTLAEAADLIRREHNPNVRMVVDTYHVVKEGEKADAIRPLKGLVAHMHCAEGNGRGPLGHRGEDHRPYFRALKEIGYDGRVSIEARWDDFDRQLPPAVAELRRQWDSA